MCQARCWAGEHRRPAMKFFNKLRRDTKAATAIEYGLIAALIAVAGIAAMTSVGTSVKGTFENVNNGLTGAAAGEGD